MNEELGKLKSERNQTADKLGLYNSVTAELIEVKDNLKRLRAERKTLKNAPKFLKKSFKLLYMDIFMRNYACIVGAIIASIILSPISFEISIILPIILASGLIALALDANSIINYLIETESVRKLKKSKTLEQIDTEISKEESKEEKYKEELGYMSDVIPEELTEQIEKSSKLITGMETELRRITDARNSVISAYRRTYNATIHEDPSDEALEAGVAMRLERGL